jgi:hypothetical protein
VPRRGARAAAAAGGAREILAEAYLDNVDKTRVAKNLVPRVELLGYAV